MHEKEGECSRRDAAAGVFEATAIKYDQMARTVREEGSSIIIDFDEPVPFYGWYLEVRRETMEGHHSMVLIRPSSSLNKALTLVSLSLSLPPPPGGAGGGGGGGGGRGGGGAGGGGG